MRGTGSGTPGRLPYTKWHRKCTQLALRIHRFPTLDKKYCFPLQLVESMDENLVIQRPYCTVTTKICAQGDARSLKQCCPVSAVIVMVTTSSGWSQALDFIAPRLSWDCSSQSSPCGPAHSAGLRQRSFTGPTPRGHSLMSADTFHHDPDRVVTGT